MTSRIPILTKSMKRIVAFGNPLLDTSILLSDTSLLKKFNLKENDQKEVPENELKTLFRYVLDSEHHVNAGGCAQNCIRVMQWMMRKQCDATIFGSVGSDEEATILRKLLANDGVKTKYIVQKHLPTGKTIALVKGENRSLVAHIGAAEKLPLDALLAEDQFHESMAKSDFIYIEGFFLTNRVETAKYLVNCDYHRKTILFNIAGRYVCNLLPDTMKYFVERSDVVFGNKEEFEAVTNIMHFQSIRDLAQVLLKNGRNKMKKYGNMLVITDGPDPVLCFYDRGKSYKFEVPKMNETDIKDTTGAGDAFAGGFIAALWSDLSIEDCVRTGCYAAQQIIRQVGCSLPKFYPEILDGN
nr:adenosine kinase 2-like [Leptinotarsa decemlineata]